MFEEFTANSQQTNDEEFQNSFNNRDESSYDFKGLLRLWAIEHRISHSGINDLLKILKSVGFSVPKDSRTMMFTPTNVEIRMLSNGKLWYQGIVIYV